MAEVINTELVDLSVEGLSRNEIIRHLANKIDLDDRINNFEGYFDSVIEREELTSTGIGFGIAIPHGKCSHVKATTVAFGRLKNEVDWNSLDGKNVTIVFLLAVPEECKGDQHLRMIAGLSRKLIHDEFRNKLETAEDKQEIVELINDSLTSITV
ncbi:PTS sugar transporter subunit IIA [Enterococcus sp. BWB1-3]|uniref:PTS sugar transporter subunit IIA n=1 Tax=unclassified Enterococcus TaxID=2608891 RepID=UPI00192231CD|nr:MULTISPECIES: PTS sugar transporter subunit IIA [unclassified Enterococcus]MBL1229803.1 PTS sugar transporter subunit IIA [Enterococcus sp. BWB1-3]MCB5952447.1 fructose PTS transporter subunit IIA [Enterococcus sp. BWT-B8]MCB5955399.1 fructose PTS transporter subunit IIA [Enterococcus sp. CWB-B31]